MGTPILLTGVSSTSLDCEPKLGEWNRATTKVDTYSDTSAWICFEDTEDDEVLDAREDASWR